MPALIPTDYHCKITWLGIVANRDDTLRSTSLAKVTATFAGFEGEAHGGLTRPSCARVTSQHPKGTEIRNARQLTILSAEELAQIAQDMGLETLDPALVGASMVVEGIPDFTNIPPSSRLQGPSGATVTIDMANRPCVLPAKPINDEAPGYGRAFKPAAKGRRGVTAWVEREGLFSLGDTLRLHIPDQPAWREAASSCS